MLRTLLTLAAACLLTGLLASPPPASAGEDSEADQRLELVLDASGSMSEPDASGTSKIKAARTALDSVIDDLPTEAQVGLRVYGATVDTGKGACTDSQQVAEIDTDNRDELRAAVREYEPLGETPIGYALERAAKDLGTDELGTIVLVSDGESTCRPSPCPVAKRLSKQGFDLKVDVVGLDVDAKARKQLQCVAAAGNGSYYDADDADSLTERLTVTSTRAFRPFDLTGTPIQGTQRPTSAPVVEPGTQYLDDLPKPNRSIYYRIQRTVPGSTIHVGTTGRTSAGSIGSSVAMSLSTPDGSGHCASEGSYSNSIGARRPLLAGSASSWSDDQQDPCNTSDALLLEIKIGVDADLAGRPFELLAYEEPPLADATDAGPPSVQDATWQHLEPSRPRSGVVPGTSIANAPVLDDGTYALDIASGETQVFAVPVDWGQQLQAQIDADLKEEAYDRAGGFSGFDAQIYGPVREGATVSMFGHEPKDFTTTPLGNFRYEDHHHWRRGAMTAPVRYLNRTSTTGDIKASALPGYRYVEVDYSVLDDPTVPYELTIKVRGTAGEGAPTYAETDDLAAPSVATVGQAAMTDAGPTATPQPASPSEDATPGATDRDGSGRSMIGGVAVGALIALAVVIAVATVVVRRSRRT